MQSTILTLAVLAATVVADLGTGTIINACNYEVNLANVPAADGVHQIYTTTLAPNGGSYSQEWTSLTNGDGWSMKLNPSSDDSTVMQFEYTYSSAAPNDLWFDMSYVNGMPFGKDWVISSNSLDCVVKQTAYNDPTDDANGMQPLCNPSTSVTVTLCSLNAGAAAVSSVVSELTPAATTSPAEQASTTIVEQPSTTSVVDDRVVEPNTASTTSTSTYTSVVPTTFATQTTATHTHHGHVVTKVDTVVATQVVTVEGDAVVVEKRHAHRHNHAAHGN